MNKKSFEVAKNNEFIVKLMENVNGINLSKDEETKLKVMIRYELSGTLFDNIPKIYSIISAEFKSPEKIILIPFSDGNIQYLNIQRLGY